MIRLFSPEEWIALSESMWNRSFIYNNCLRLAIELGRRDLVSLGMAQHFSLVAIVWLMKAVSLHGSGLVVVRFSDCPSNQFLTGNELLTACISGNGEYASYFRGYIEIYAKGTLPTACAGFSPAYNWVDAGICNCLFSLYDLFYRLRFDVNW